MKYWIYNIRHHDFLCDVTWVRVFNDFEKAIIFNSLEEANKHLNSSTIVVDEKQIEYYKNLSLINEIII